MNKLKVELIDCQNCAVNNSDGNCVYCNGKEYLAKVGGTILFWGPSKDPTFIKSPEYLRFKKTTKTLMFFANLVMLILTTVIIAVTGLKGGQNFVLDILTKSTPATFLWWVLSGLLLITAFNYFYREAKIKPVKDFGPVPTHDSLFRRVDIAKAFEGDLVTTLNLAIISAHKANKTPNIWWLLRELMSDNKFLWMIVKMELNPQLISGFVDFRLNNFESRENWEKDWDKVLLEAYLEGARMRADEISFNHLFLAMIKADPEIAHIFDELGQSPREIETVCLWQEKINKQIARNREYREKSRFKPMGHMNRAWTAVPTPILDSFGQDLTAMAKFEALERLIGREKEISQTINVLEKMSKNNILFIGESGVGKSTIANGLAYKMVSEEVPEMLKDKRLINLNITRLFSSAGDGAERLFLSALNEVIRAKNVILYIDDLHLLAGIKTRSGGPMDALAILSETLSKYRIQFIASTSPEGYSKYISTYDQIVSELTAIEIPEVDNETAIAILEEVTHRIENQNQVLITYPALKMAVELSADLITEKKLPSKAYDLLTEAAVVARNQNKKLMTKQDIINLMQEKTHVPIAQVTTEESKLLLNLHDELHKRVIGQELAVKEVAEAIKRARVGLKDKSKPIASFLFVGPTGVGKTELAKALAAIYFGDEERMIRLDMSEYQEVSDIKKIIGAPPGSSEFEERGYLTEAVKKNPFSLVLLDELEKAYPNILNLFLQVLDEGKIKDSLGRTVKFNNTIIIATSNAGTPKIQEGIKNNLPHEQIEEQLMEELKKVYRPEFLNRFDGVIMFEPLKVEEIVQIAKLMIAKINKSLANQKITVEVMDEALSAFITGGYNQEFGARALYRTLQDKVKNVIAEKMLTGELKEGMKLTIINAGETRVERGQ